MTDSVMLESDEWRFPMMWLTRRWAWASEDNAAMVWSDMAVALHGAAMLQPQNSAGQRASRDLSFLREIAFTRASMCNHQ